MAKAVGIIGGISGKIGNVVFGGTTEKGEAVMRKYNPTPNNPKSSAQTAQRAKVNLVGRLSQITPAEVLVGLGGSKRRNRAMFLKNCMLAASTATIEGVLQANIDPEDIVFSKGSAPLSAAMGTVTIDATGLETSLQLSDATLAGKYGERLIMVIVDPKTEGGYSILRYEDHVLEGTTSTPVRLDYGAIVAEDSMVVLYRVPFVLTPMGASMVYEGMSNDTHNIIAAVLQTEGAVKAFGPSSMQSKQVFTEA